jgi:hypothetical protein
MENGRKLDDVRPGAYGVFSSPCGREPAGWENEVCHALALCFAPRSAAGHHRCSVAAVGLMPGRPSRRPGPRRVASNPGGNVGQRLETLLAGLPTARRGVGPRRGRRSGRAIVERAVWART